MSEPDAYVRQCLLTGGARHNHGTRQSKNAVNVI
jgi:hypothetical protein